MLQRIDILHIYFGTAGIAGSYMHEIYRVLESKFNQKIIVNFHYPFPEGFKIGYRFSELTGSNLLGKWRKARLALRYFELLIALVFSFTIISIYRPRMLNYSVTSNLKIEEFFLRSIRLLFPKMVLCITCHDAIPFKSDFNKADETNEIRKNMYSKIADKILVHNLFSIRILSDQFNINPKKCYVVPFPPMNCKSHSQAISLKKDIDFIFIGHMREEKGVLVLLEAWKKYKITIKSDKKLVIAGNLLTKYKAIFNKYSLNELDVTLIDEFIDDETFVRLLSRSKILILPYLIGTNSGFPHLAMNCATLPIVSNLEFFQELSFIDHNNFFQSNSSYSLAKMLIELEKRQLKIKEEDYGKYKLDFKLIWVEVIQKILVEQKKFELC